MVMLCDVLSIPFKSPSEWDKVPTCIEKYNRNKVSMYDLYLALEQVEHPVPLYVLDLMLENHPNLIGDNKTFRTICLIAFQSKHTSFSIFRSLLQVCGRDSLSVAETILSHSYHSNFDQFAKARSLIRYKPELLNYFNNNGNLLIHECCKECESPAMLQVLVEEYHNRALSWLEKNNEGKSPIDILMEKEYMYESRPMLDTILNAFPQLPSEMDVEEYGLLHAACKISNLGFIVQILESYPEQLKSLHFVDKELRTPLQVACIYGGNQVIRFLVEKEKDMGLIPKSFYTSRLNPIQLACLNPNADMSIIEFLSVMYGYDSHSFPNEIWHNRLLHVCAMGYNTDLAAELLLKFPQALVMTSNTGSYPVNLACRSSTSEMVTLLLSKTLQLYRDCSEGLCSRRLLQDACSNPLLNESILQQIFHLSKLTPEIVNEMKLLHLAVQSKSFSACKLILKFNPEALLELSENCYPIFVACRTKSIRIICVVFNALYKYFMKSTSNNIELGYSTIFYENMKGESAWEEIMKLCLAEYKIESYGLFERGVWSCIQFVLSNYARKRAKKDGTNIPLFHAAVILITNLDLLTVIVYHRLMHFDISIVDEKGRNGLHILAKCIGKSCKMTPELHISLKWQVITKYVMGVATFETKSMLAPDSYGRIPLHICASSNMDSNAGLIHFLQANFSALHIPDPITGLYPFMLIASRGKSDPDSGSATSIYCLLRADPSVLTRHYK